MVKFLEKICVDAFIWNAAVFPRGSFFSSEDTLLEMSVCQLRLGGNVIFSAAYQDRRLNFLSMFIIMSIQYIIYLYRHSVTAILEKSFFLGS